jgi:hypothetical protein
MWGERQRERERERFLSLSRSSSVSLDLKEITQISSFIATKSGIEIALFGTVTV